MAQRVEDLLSRMTLAEKGRADERPFLQRGRDQFSNLILNQHVRYLILRQRPAIAQLATNLNNAQAQAEGTRLGIPLVITSNPLNTLGGGNAVFEPGAAPASSRFGPARWALPQRTTSSSFAILRISRASSGATPAFGGCTACRSI